MRFSPVLAAALWAAFAVNSRAAQPLTQPATPASVWILDMRDCLKPEWPKEALRREQSGTVNLSYLVDIHGRVAESVVVKSSGFELLDEAARISILACTVQLRPDATGPAVEWQKLAFVWTLENARVNDPVLQSAADAGNVSAQNNLGYAYETGVGVAREYREALRLYLLSASQGYGRAQEALGGLYEHGWGVATDVDKALGYYRLAAAQDFPPGLRQMGAVYEFGKGVMADAAQALSYYERAAKAGDVKAMQRLAGVYARGELGQTVDAGKAADWTQKAEHR